uniref:Uncharacterized protein n=1 Tax=Arundo donax TaxID=35708 RepID=A0A0A8YJX6_ARUDO
MDNTSTQCRKCQVTVCLTTSLSTTTKRSTSSTNC